MRKNNKPNIDKALLESLCGYQASESEICAVFRTNPKFLKSWVKREYGKTWAKFYKEFSARGKLKIRENQIKLSSKSPEMAKYLSEKYLNQNEKPKNLGGRPRKYDNPEELQKAVDSYFRERDELKKPYTITGLALALGFNSRQSLLNYQGDKRFLDIIKKAKSKVEAFYEESLHSGQSVAGIIFCLKANFKWDDKSPTEDTDKQDTQVYEVKIVKTKENANPN